MSIIELAQQILEKEKNGLHYKEIAEKAMILDKSLGNDLDSCAQRIAQTLSSHVNRHNKKPTAIFKRINNGKGSFKAGMYALIKRAAPKPPVPTPNGTPVATTFTGKAGEYGVFSELLYWGYNPAMMVVDYGVDIVAAKDGDYFHIQVKTANPNANKTFAYKINKDTFDLHNNAKTFYVFVVRRDIKGRPLSDYIIMPSNMIYHLLTSGVITSNRDIAFSINVENGVFRVNNKFDITNVNDFSLIR